MQNDPTQVQGNEPLGEERVRERIVEEEELATRRELDERVRALKPWAYLGGVLSILAAAAAGVALFLLFQADGRQGASRDAVQELRGDVEQLQEDVSTSTEAAEDARREVRSLSDRVEEIEGGGDQQADIDGRVDQLEQSIEELTQDIEQLSQQGNGGTSSP